MLKNTLLIIAALGMWAASSSLTTLGIQGASAWSDVLDLGGEVLFAAGVLFIFVRQAISAYHRHEHVSSQINHSR